MTPVVPLVLMRVAGLPVRDLDALVAPELGGLLERAAIRRDRAEELGRRVAGALHDVVPRLSDEARREALRLRRDAHNGRCSDRTRAAAGAVEGHLDRELRDLVGSWLRSVTALRESLAETDRAAAAHVAAAGRQVFGLLTRPGIMSTLALASPAFTRVLLGPGSARTCPPDSRTCRTAVSYATRAALKPSPFGALGRTVPSTATVSSPLHLAVALVRACAQHPRLSSRFPSRVNPSLRDVAGTWYAMLPCYDVPTGLLPHRWDELTDASLYVPGHLIPDHPDSARPLDNWPLAGTELAGRWVEMGLLLPDVPWRSGERDWLARIADRVPTGPVSGALAELKRAEQRMPAADAAERVRLDARVRQAAADAFERLETSPPAWLRNAPLFHETLPADDVPLPALPPQVSEDLGVVAARIRAELGRTRLYEGLVRHFVARYGPGGRCEDLLEFLYTYPWTSAPSPARPPQPGGTLGFPAATVFYQLAADDRAALDRGDYTLVVNQVCVEPGGQAARWDGTHGTADTLRAWISSLHPGCTVYELLAGADFAAVQMPAARLFECVAWPSDLGPPQGRDLRGFAVTHDRRTGTLQVRDPAGARAAFVYLGAMPLPLLHGPVRLLATLTHPWIPASLETPGPPGTPAARMRQGRVVMSRARWRLPAAAVPRRTGSWARHLADLDVWRAAHAVPRQVFVRRGGRKPFWVDFRAPHTIALLDHELTGGEIELTEALPTREQHWVRDDSGRARAAEFVALVRLDGGA
ncbi:lantibiotic dehydratase [Nonomuraea sp. NPDC003560]|uniref:lantibiotic dehydratase n=1 Tax=Nonomuraea sp. NPDC003560 TaxID=3364341 RepID=UPI00368C8BEF